MTVEIFGIRHHGQGSAKSLLKAFEEFSPDCILIEGPSEANEIIHFVSDRNLKPPVAILVYLKNNPKKSVSYPFAVFSPEWQAMKYGINKNINVSFIDLPQYYQLRDEEDDLSKSEDLLKLADENKNITPVNEYKNDPIKFFANIAGYEDVEVWWDNFIEVRKDYSDIFKALDMMVSSIRENELFINNSSLEAQRESYMRQSIRKSLKDGFKKIAVVCGAWHIPALKIENYKQKDDKNILSKLKKEYTISTWIPWTYNKLSSYSGYGAGVESPNWYEHIWKNQNDITIKWVIKAAKLFRKNDADVSSASIIETVRLAETLALLRDRNSVGLSEINESIKSVICLGNTYKFDLIKKELIIGNEIGTIPSNVPLTPLQTDFNDLMKKFRLKKETEPKEIDLDLRKENDKQKSYFFHRIKILNIQMVKNIDYKNKKGTFHEFWEMQWNETFEINLIDSSIWGNTIKEASNNLVIHKSEQLNDLYELVNILFATLFSDIPDALNKIINKIKVESSLSFDVVKLIKSVPIFVKLLRYGDVRKTSLIHIKEILDGIISRICIGLSTVCTNINVEAAQEILKDIISFNDSIMLLRDKEYISLWFKTVISLSENNSINSLIKGYTDRLCLDNNLRDINKIYTKMSYELSVNKDILESASWLEGFLKGSVLVLINNDSLLSLIDNWVTNISDEKFLEIVPILRKNFSDFNMSEKKQVLDFILNTDTINEINTSINKENFSKSQAEKVLPVLKLLMGIK